MLQQRPTAPSNLNQAANARVIERARILIDEIITASYPELKGTAIQIKQFQSKSDYSKARFGVPQFFFGRMRYLVFVNPRVFDRDLQAISRGYGEGLKEYRRWLYLNIPPSKIAEKARNYFSPEEIDAILDKSCARPELLAYWLKHVPLNLDQILARK